MKINTISASGYVPVINKHNQAFCGIIKEYALDTDELDKSIKNLEKESYIWQREGLNLLNKYWDLSCVYVKNYNKLKELSKNSKQDYDLMHNIVSNLRKIKLNLTLNPDDYLI